ncbi:MAG: TonB-dependent receptor [Rikenellaceae bacterium]
MKRKLSLLAMLSVALTATAQDDTQHSIDEIVVTATGSPCRLVDSPVPITIITQQEIEQSCVTTLDEALVALSPSFSKHVSGMGTTLSFNGLEEDYYLILENGRRMAGEDPFNRIDLSRVQRIEILSGAAAALYGANAVGGVINIITSMPDSAVSIQMHTRYSSEERITQTANVGFQIGQLTSNTTLAKQSAGSWQMSEYEEEGDELVTSDHVASAGFDRKSVTQKFEYRVNEDLDLSANIGYYNYETDRPQSSFFSYSYNLLHQDLSYGVGANYRLSDRSTIVASYNGEEYTKYYTYFSASKYGQKVFNKNTTYHNANVRGTFGLYEGNTLSAGFEYSRNGLEDSDETEVFSDTYALFAQDEISIARNLSGVVGVRLSYQKAFDLYASPNASLMYKLGKLNLRASYASGFRAPTLSELYAERNESSTKISYSNPDLQPETSNYTSFTAEFNNRWLFISATGFRNGISDMIEYAGLDYEEEDEDGELLPVQQKVNYEKAEVLGINLSFNAKLTNNLSIKASYTGLNPRNISGDCPIDKSIRNAATASAQWSKSWERYKLNINISGRINGERYYEYDNSYAPSYQLWDLNTYHTFEFGNFYLEPAIGIENLFNYTDDRPWSSNYATLTPGRALYASLTIRFKN